MSDNVITVEVGTHSRNIEVSVSGNNRSIGVGIDRGIPDFPIYRGTHTFTATDTEQTIPLANMSLLQDIVINPIPENYGLITYDGTTLTVS